jgi:hypothetical protein
MSTCLSKMLLFLFLVGAALHQQQVHWKWTEIFVSCTWPKIN